MTLRGTEEEMLWKSQVLNEKRPDLCRCLTPKEHYPYLRSKYILGHDDEEIIESQVSTRQKAHTLIDILIKKVPLGYDELVKSLIQEKTQIHLAEMLNKEYEKKKRHSLQVQIQSAPVSLTCHGTSISDLCVDTDKLPKPQMPKKTIKDRDKDSDIKKETKKDIILELEPGSKFDSKV